MAISGYKHCMHACMHAYSYVQYVLEYRVRMYVLMYSVCIVQRTYAVTLCREAIEFVTVTMHEISIDRFSKGSERSRYTHP